MERIIEKIKCGDFEILEENKICIGNKIYSMEILNKMVKIGDNVVCIGILYEKIKQRLENIKILLERELIEGNVIAIIKLDDENCQLITTNGKINVGIITEEEDDWTDIKIVYKGFEIAPPHHIDEAIRLLIEEE